MCLLCLIQFAGEAAVTGAASVCGARQGEYKVDKLVEKKAKGRDWRSYLCCCNRYNPLKDVDSKMVFLHGVLYLEVIAAKDLHDMDNSFFRSSKDVSDPYVTVDTCFNGKKSCRIAKTSIIYDSLNPHWDEKYRIELCHETESLLFSIKDIDLIGIESMGFVSIRADELACEERIGGWYPIIDKTGNPAGSLNLSLHYMSVASITRSNEVIDTVFPMHSGCRVRLYQDAHMLHENPCTKVDKADGTPYEGPQLWVDVAQQLNEARELIYIIGWSVKHDLVLLRDGENEETLGDLLIRKAEEGVRVLLLLWNELLSTDVYTPGIMGTHDEETRIFFEGTEVEVVLAPRKKGKSKLMETNFVATLYTHHQKSIVVDAPIPGDERRRLIGFVGGIDLTDGRWDTPEHNLFSTLSKEHCEDFYNGCCSTKPNVGPRQPWHDIHARVEGPVVQDIVQNFVERWRKQAVGNEHRLVPLDDEKFDVDWVFDGDSDDRSYGVQFFRSINSDSAHFRTDALDKLLTRKGRMYDNSLQRAYVHHIRRAKNFIYIENQYFLGSSHGWFSPEAKCPHLIPVEMATKIVNSIKDGSHFRVYVVIPLHPEGDPASTAVQEILHWQHMTMEMMYKKIAKAISKAGSSALPTDYLSFFCLGKKEANIPDGLFEPEPDSVADKARQHMRFMIYVHSKMAIFDDEYCIIGSANINERSMSGNRDSEMAVGLFEQGVTKEDCGSDLKGNICNFRRSLWGEHCGGHNAVHDDPSSEDCMTWMREQGEQNLLHFLADEPEERDQHLLLYPVAVSRDGHVTKRADCKVFPDTQASILGKNSLLLPNSLTT